MYAFGKATCGKISVYEAMFAMRFAVLKSAIVAYDCALLA